MEISLTMILILGLLGIIVVGGSIGAFWYFFIRGKIPVIISERKGDSLVPVRKMRIPLTQETLEYDKATYVVDPTRTIDGKLFYEKNKIQPLTFDLKIKPNAELLYKILKTQIYGAIFDDNSLTLIGIVTIAGVLIAVGVSIYGVVLIGEMQKEILVNRAMIGNITRYLYSGGGGVIIP